MFTDAEKERLAGDIAKGIGTMLGQEYRKHRGWWWLFSLGKPTRPLRPDEVQWHLEHNHSPFAGGGLETNDPLWFADPAEITHCRCGASLCCCKICKAKWCLDHQPNPLICPGCGDRGTGS